MLIDDFQEGANCRHKCRVRGLQTPFHFRDLEVLGNSLPFVTHNIEEKRMCGTSAPIGTVCSEQCSARKSIT